MRVVLAEQMKEIDYLTQTEYGLAGSVLMEHAALAILEEVKKDFGPLVNKNIIICCGKGNNGGDGLALARLMQNTKANITVVLLFKKSEYRDLAELNLKVAAKYGVKTLEWELVTDELWNRADLIIDAILGTGTMGAPRKNVLAAILQINKLKKSVIAVDLPSGIDVNTGLVPNTAIFAYKTVTFGLPKPGLLCFPGAEYVGNLVVNTINFPQELLAATKWQMESLTIEEAKSLLPSKKATVHKGSNGHVLMIGGSAGMMGAITLAAGAALRSGCGLVTVGTQPEVIFWEKPLEVIALEEELLDYDNFRYNTLLLGPGLGTTESSRKRMESILNKELNVPMVIDADALNILAENELLWSKIKGPVIITPHPGEFSRLTGLTTKEIQEKRIAVAEDFAQKRKVIVVLKGARTIIAHPWQRTYINLTGNSGMATAGMGDILAGMITSFLAQGLSAIEAAVLGVYLHGFTGDQLAKKMNKNGIIASDLLKELPRAMQKVADI